MLLEPDQGGEKTEVHTQSAEHSGDTEWNSGYKSLSLKAGCPQPLELASFWITKFSG